MPRLLLLTGDAITRLLLGAATLADEACKGLDTGTLRLDTAALLADEGSGSARDELAAETCRLEARRDEGAPKLVDELDAGALI